MSAPFILFRPSDSGFADAGITGKRGELPTKRFEKDIAHVGTYKHPRDGWTLNITPEKIDAWVSNFQRMKTAGVDVEVVKDHRHDAEAVVGYVTDMRREGDRLIAVHEMVGDDAIKLAQVVRNVSPWIERNFKDGHGTAYGESIIHSAIVQGPVIPGQEPFKAIAASMRAGNPDALLFSIEGNTMPLDLAPFKTLLGKPELTETELATAVRERLTAAESAKTTAENEARDMKAKVLSLEGQLTALKAKPEPDAEVLDMLADGAGDGFDALATNGNITPAIAASLKTLFVGAPKSRNAYALSGRVSGHETSIAKQLITILKDNKPTPAAGHKTGLQMSTGRGEVTAEDKAAAAKQLKAGAGIN